MRPQAAQRMIDRLTAAVSADPRIVGLTLGGSAGAGTMDEFSDVDAVLELRAEAEAASVAYLEAVARPSR